MRCLVIFDMDGVIIDSEPLHLSCEKEIFELLGISISKEQHLSFVGTTNKSMWEQLKKIYNIPQSVTVLVKQQQSIYLELLKKDKTINPIPYVETLIKSLHENGYILGLASSSPHSQIDYILDMLNLKPFFRNIISGDDVKNGKPNPGIFQKISAVSRISPENCIVIEDSFNGVIAAKNAGMKCIGFKNPNSGNQDLGNADLIINSFSELTPNMIYRLLIE